VAEVIYFRLTVFIAIFFFSACASISESSARFKSVDYNICDDEWVFWLEVPDGDSELGMARVPTSNVEVLTRTDGKTYATVKFFGSYDPVRCRYSRAVVLVPPGSELNLKKTIRIVPK
jgi:hypothetical protein